MRSILAIDIGNTNITVGLFNGSRLIRKYKIPTGLRSLRFLPADMAILSSVVPKALPGVVSSLKKAGICEITVVGRNVKVPIRNMYKAKSQVGQDRLVNAFAVKYIYGSPAVVVDFGTAITFDIISKRGDYLGGLILPGIELSLKSLYERTALLPKVELKDEPHIIGKDTRSSMRGGILFGFGAMCDGLISRYRKMLGKSMKVIATGGNAQLIKKYAGSIQVVDEDLTLKGLLLIKNRQLNGDK